MESTLSTSLQSPIRSHSSDIRRRSSQELLWQRYLRDLEQPTGALSSRAAQGLRAVWRYLRAATDGRFPIPRAAPTQDHGIILSWETADHYLEIEVFEYGHYDWFYREEEAAEYVGGEDRTPGVPDPDLERHLGLFS